MNLPGFTAEASLYATSRRYNLIRILDDLTDYRAGSRTDGILVPAAASILKRQPRKRVRSVPVSIRRVTATIQRRGQPSGVSTTANPSISPRRVHRRSPKPLASRMSAMVGKKSSRS